MKGKMPDPTPCSKCPIRKKAVFRQFSDKELDFIEQFKTGELVVEAGATILLEEHKSPHLYTMLDGWGSRQKQTVDGRRQILNFVLPGDMIGLQLAMMDEMQHSVTALTQSTLCVFQREKIWDIFKDYPALSFSMTWMAAREEQLLDGHLLNVGQRRAIERVAYLVLHLYERAEEVGYAGNYAMRSPFTQGDFADALGITPVHTSRTLKKLQSRGLIRWKDDVITILDRQKLEKLAAYERQDDDLRPIL